MLEGQVIGRYRITEKIATGGMGEVFAACHELMSRDAVVKVLLPEMSVRENLVKRFFQEAQAAARVEHPGIVEVFDFGYNDDGRAYIIMERLRGETLGARLRRMQVLPVAQAVTLVKQMASAIGAAHAQEIFHRDLKPGNVFIVPDPEVPTGERIKVLDFGLAKLAGDQQASLVTRIGTVFGTPSYMAPEQFRDSAQIDHRADLYSIGCMFYACMCGRPPFGSGGMELMAAHLRDTATPPRELRFDIPPDVERVILKLLEKAPEARFQSCSELVAALRRATLAVGPALSQKAARSDDDNHDDSQVALETMHRQQAMALPPPIAVRRTSNRFERIETRGFASTRPSGGYEQMSDSAPGSDPPQVSLSMMVEDGPAASDDAIPHGPMTGTSSVTASAGEMRGPSSKAGSWMFWITASVVVLGGLGALVFAPDKKPVAVESVSQPGEPIPASAETAERPAESPASVVTDTHDAPESDRERFLAALDANTTYDDATRDLLWVEFTTATDLLDRGQCDELDRQTATITGEFPDERPFFSALVQRCSKSAGSPGTAE